MLFYFKGSNILFYCAKAWWKEKDTPNNFQMINISNENIIVPKKKKINNRKDFVDDKIIILLLQSIDISPVLATVFNGISFQVEVL